jgi:hypothetical protein
VFSKARRVQEFGSSSWISGLRFFWKTKRVVLWERMSLSHCLICINAICNKKHRVTSVPLSPQT